MYKEGICAGTVKGTGAVKVTGTDIDAFYGGASTFPLKLFLNDGAPEPKTNRTHAINVLKNDAFAYLGHGIIHPGAV